MEAEDNDWEGLVDEANDEWQEGELKDWDNLPEHAEELKNMLKSDIEALEDIVGEEVTYDDLNSVALATPKLIV